MATAGPFRSAAKTEGAFLFDPVHAGVAGMPLRFPQPWSIVEHEESFVIHDAIGQPLTFVYFEPDTANETRCKIMPRLTRDEARRIAAKHRQAAGAAEDSLMCPACQTGLRGLRDVAQIMVLQKVCAF